MGSFLFYTCYIRYRGGIRLAQSDGHTKSLHRIELAIFREGTQIRSYKFKVNPEEYTETWKQRSTVFRTRTQNVVEDFGPDVPEIVFSGTTGWTKDSRGKSGKQRLDELKSFIRGYAKSGFSTEMGNTVQDELRFYNHTDGGSYRVHLAPDGLVITRSVQKPILFDYKISLQVLYDLSEPNDREVDDALIGNKLSAYKTTSNVVNPNGTRPTHQGAKQAVDRFTGVNSGRVPPESDRNYSNNNVKDSNYILYD